MQSFAYWVLAEVARLKGNVSREREHLNACLGVQAFTSITHALALRRIQALDENDRYGSAPSRGDPYPWLRSTSDLTILR